ncbi:MAG TPA: aquaporin, partial [Arthrobacter sp.]|nr:aquaporin [Arthrobacter sp.]
GNAPFNPARATASALFSSPDALGQLWLFWVAPLVGAALAGLVFRGFALTTPAAGPGPDTASADDQTGGWEADGEDKVDGADRDGNATVAAESGAPAAISTDGDARTGPGAEDADSEEARAFFEGGRGK